MRSGDGWTSCRAGHRHWGLFGAAGLLIHDGQRVVLQHRSPWTHQGDTWGVPGGAMDSHESAVQAALREAGEEAGIRASDVDPLGLFIDDHGGWSYTTVIAAPRIELAPQATNDESVAVCWQQTAAVTGLTLHSGFAQSWPLLRVRPRPLRLIVDPELVDHPLLAQLAERGISVSKIPDGAGLIHRRLFTVSTPTDPAQALAAGDVARTVSCVADLVALGDD